jgi:hypothetical protein
MPGTIQYGVSSVLARAMIHDPSLPYSRMNDNLGYKKDE